MKLIFTFSSASALAWSPLYEGSNGLKFAFLVMLQRSGHLVIWKVTDGREDRLQFAGLHDLQLADPSAVHLTAGGDDCCLLLAGSHRGVVKAWTINNWTDDRHPSCTPLGAVFPDEDGIAVAAIQSHFASAPFRVVYAVKNSALVAASVQLDGNGMRIVDTAFVLLPSVQISGENFSSAKKKTKFLL